MSPNPGGYFPPPEIKVPFFGCSHTISRLSLILGGPPGDTHTPPSIVFGDSDQSFGRGAADVDVLRGEDGF